MKPREAREVARGLTACARPRRRGEEGSPREGRRREGSQSQRVGGGPGRSLAREALRGPGCWDGAAPPGRRAARPGLLYLLVLLQGVSHSLAPGRNTPSCPHSPPGGSSCWPWHTRAPRLGLTLTGPLWLRIRRPGSRSGLGASCGPSPGRQHQEAAGQLQGRRSLVPGPPP